MVKRLKGFYLRDIFENRYKGKLRLDNKRCATVEKNVNLM